MTDMVFPPEAVEAVARQVFFAKHGLDWDFAWFDEAKRTEARRNASGFALMGLEAALPHLRPLFETATNAPANAFELLLTSPTEQFDKRSEILASIDAYSKAVPATASAHAPASPAGIFHSEVEVKSLIETATKVALELGRKEALEEAAKLADDLAAGVANPEKPYNDAFIHACGVVARHIREIGTKEAQP